MTLDIYQIDEDKATAPEMLAAHMYTFLKEDGCKLGFKQAAIDPKLVGQAVKAHKRYAVLVTSNLPEKLASKQDFDEFNFMLFTYDPKERTFWFTSNSMWLNEREDDLDNLRKYGLEKTFPDYAAEVCDQREYGSGYGMGIAPDDVDKVSAQLLKADKITVELEKDGVK